MLDSKVQTHWNPLDLKTDLGLVLPRRQKGEEKAHRQFDNRTILYQRGCSKGAKNTCRENYWSNIAV